MARKRLGLLASLFAALGLMIGVPGAAPASSRTSPTHPIRAQTPDKHGRQIWVSRYHGSFGDNEANALAVSPDGSRVFVTGQSDGSDGRYGTATVAYDASTGAKLWVSRYTAPSDGLAFTVAAGVSPDGSRVFVTGYVFGPADDYLTIAYDASTGEQLWLSQYDGPGNRDDSARALAVSPDGSKVYVTGSARAQGSDYDYSTLAYDASTGAQLWVSLYGDQVDAAHDTAWGDPSSIAVSPDGSMIFVTGSAAAPADTYDFATVAYGASTGAQIWVGRHNGPGSGSDFAEALSVSPDGIEVFVTGASVGPGIPNDYETVAYAAATGAQLWDSRYDGPAGGSDRAVAIGVSPDGTKVVVTGQSPAADGSDDTATVGYDASSGAQLWVKRFDGLAHTYAVPTALVVSPAGPTVFVAGYMPAGNRAWNYFTLAYDASTGTRSWMRQYDGAVHGNDDASAIGISPDGSRLFVTGNSVGPAGNRDYATVAETVS